MALSIRSHSLKIALVTLFVMFFVLPNTTHGAFCPINSDNWDETKQITTFEGEYYKYESDKNYWSYLCDFGTDSTYTIGDINSYGTGPYRYYINQPVNIATSSICGGSCGERHFYAYIRYESNIGSDYDFLLFYSDYDEHGYPVTLSGIQQEPTQQNQYINILSPSYGSTTQNTVSLSVSFKTPFSLDIRPATKRTIIIKDAISQSEEWRYSVLLPSNSSENITINITTPPLVDGSKDITAFYETETGLIYSEIAQSFFNVNTNTYYLATGFQTPKSTPTETQNDCTTFDIGCQFQKAIVFLFYPSNAVLDRFSNIWQNIATKKPFGYVTMTIDALTNLDTNSAHAFDIGEVPFQQAIFDPFKIALGSILWAIYAIFFYQRRLKNLDI